MDNFTIGRTVSRKSSPDAMRICLGDFPGQVSPRYSWDAHTIDHGVFNAHGCAHGNAD